MLKTQPEIVDDCEIQDSVKPIKRRESLPLKLRSLSLESLSKMKRDCNPIRLEKK